ncbi:hypothetical protein [Treponema sp.]|uniref:hypothetical protein n=1 Tax=Treponema sp. TaxID=166 RepID=UPI0025FD3BA5|nr:hypothetical protein [Treponema sp.]MCR5217407.1 hypothetical protein [Treponema sp.]
MKKFFVFLITLVAPALCFSNTKNNSQDINFPQAVFSQQNSACLNKMSYSSEYDEAKSLQSDLFSLIFELLFLQNLTVYYDAYPFADGDNYLRYASDKNEADGKAWRYTIETAAFYYPHTKTIGNCTRLEGTVWHFFGPVFDNQVFKKTDEDFFYGYFNLGAQYYLFQTNPLSASFFIQWSHLYGDIKDDGVGFGFILKSFIARKVLLEYRIYASDFTSDEDKNSKYDSDSIIESNLEAGIMLADGIELFLGWKIQQNGFTQIQCSAASLGLKKHF